MRVGDFSVEVVSADGATRELDSGHILARPGQVYADLPITTAAARDEDYRTSEEYRVTTHQVSRALQDAIQTGSTGP